MLRVTLLAIIIIIFLSKCSLEFKWNDKFHSAMIFSIYLHCSARGLYQVNQANMNLLFLLQTSHVSPPSLWFANDTVIIE